MVGLMEARGLTRVLQEAQNAKDKANGKILLGRPLVVRFVDEKVGMKEDFDCLSTLTVINATFLKVLYSNDRLGESAVTEAEKARKAETERDREQKRLRYRLSSSDAHRFVAKEYDHDLL